MVIRSEEQRPVSETESGYLGRNENKEERTNETKQRTFNLRKGMIKN